MKKGIMFSVFCTVVFLAISFTAADELDELQRQIEILKEIQKHNNPVYVFGGGVGTRLDGAINTAKDLYGVPAIGIHAYSGNWVPDIFKAVVDYMDPEQGKVTGRRVLGELERIYQELGRIDMATFHSAFVVALNNVPQELDTLLSSGKLKIDNLALAGAHVTPELAEVLNKHQAKGNIKDWATFERSYVPGQQRGDLVVLDTTPLKEFRDPFGAAIAKTLVNLDLLPWFRYGIFGGGTAYYHFSPEHFMETYSPAIRKSFGISEKTEKSTRVPEIDTSQPEPKKYKIDDKYFFPPPPPPPPYTFAAAGKDPGGVLLRTGNTYKIDGSGNLKKLEETILKSRPDKEATDWKFEHEGKKYKAVAIPLKKKDTNFPKINMRYLSQQNAVVLWKGDEVVVFKLHSSDQYVKIVQIVEGKLLELKDDSIVFQTTNIVFEDEQLEK